ncbi:MAG TPA: DegT/DnrJ/EryC1/StrS aminotransferase family protein [Candidatus Binataceae bacterium]|jgi:perosamine synthetase|nr:DegT/DnrJ/EryC1/StrS aminotransferase family protein [Candidatus Binataceae bacterium]
MRTEFLPFHVPDIGEAEIASVVDTLRSGWLTSGPKTAEFESAFARYIGAEHAVAVNSCTAALQLALAASGVGPGDEVIVPTMTFAATAEVIVHLGAVPVLVDSNPRDLTIECGAVRDAISPRTKAIVPVHYGGHPCDMDKLMDLARERGLAVVEDAAHALPAHYKGRAIGTIGDFTCFSFYATKTLTTGEGGMITTDRTDQADRLRTLSLHGMSRQAWQRYTKEGDWYYEILEVGYKFNMPALAAALGLPQLQRCDRLHQIRSRLAGIYTEAFSRMAEISLLSVSPEVQHAWHLYPILLNPDRLRIDRAGFIRALKRHNIGSSVHFIPLHLHPYYRDRYKYRPRDFPAATQAYERLVSLPLYTQMSPGDVCDVIGAVAEVIRESRL